MKQSITQDEAAWLVLRTVGLILAWETLTKFAEFAYIAYNVTFYPTNIIAALGLPLPQVLMMLVYGALALYFLRYGRLCHRLLCYGARIDHIPPDSRWDEDE